MLDTKQTLEELRRVHVKLGIDFRYRLGDPANERQVSECERLVQAPLPVSFRQFCLANNGLRMETVSTISAIDAVTGRRIEIIQYVDILSTDRIPGINDLVFRDDGREGAENPWSGLLAFADYGDSNYCAFDLSEADGPVIDAFHEQPELWHSGNFIASNFGEWLAKIAESVSNEHELTFWLGNPLPRSESA